MSNQPASYADPVTRALSLLPLAASVAELEPEALREALLGLERLVNAAQGVQADLMNQLAHEAASNDAAREVGMGRHLLPHESSQDFVADEIAVTLTCTKADAARRYGIALATADHPLVSEAWRRGAVGTRKVQVICDGLTDVSAPARASVAGQAAEYATTHTAPELRRWLARRVIGADPGMAEIRRERATADRRVTITPLPDGICELSAILPGVQARQIYDTVNAIAYEAGSGDLRTMDQRRADALVDLITGRAEPPRVTISVVVPADSLLGEGAEPGYVAGLGPITSTEALLLAGIAPYGPETNGASIDGCTTPRVHDVMFRRLLSDPESGHLLGIAEEQYRPSLKLDRSVRARDVVCRFPGCSRPAQSRRSGTDLDHTTPWPEGQTSAANLAVLCRHHHRLKHSPGWNADLDAEGVMIWTTPTGQKFRTEPWSYAEPADQYSSDPTSIEDP